MSAPAAAPGADAPPAQRIWGVVPERGSGQPPRVLLLARRSEQGDVRWSLPGAVVSGDAPLPLETLRREIAAQTGISATVLRPLDPITPEARRASGGLFALGKPWTGRRRRDRCFPCSRGPLDHG
jgi:8-oxo-dGTP pyrophosphatase MutT (NUDIX family)